MRSKIVMRRIASIGAIIGITVLGLFYRPLTVNASRNPIIQAETDEIHEIASDYYEMIPKEIRSGVEGLGYKIIVTSDNDLIAKWALGVEYKGQHAKIVAVVVEDYNVIYQTSEKKYIKQLIHEVGHVYSDILDTAGGQRPYQRQQFVAAYNKEGASLGGYASGDICEFYAEAFMHYIINPNLLKSLAPSTYNCLDNDISNYIIRMGGIVTQEPKQEDKVTQKSSDEHIRREVRYICDGEDYSDRFDGYAYADRYPDLKAKYGYDLKKLFEHFIFYGEAEGRIGK